MGRNLVGAILRLKYPDKLVVKKPCVQHRSRSINRASDFDVHGFSYYVRETPTGTLLQRCRDNVNQMGMVVLIVPAAKIKTARRLAKEKRLESRLTILSLEVFVVQSVLSISATQEIEPFEAMKAIIDEYNPLTPKSKTNAITQRC